ncbi:hypothetical protein L6452_21245 [Arctium lappa]|uniref:Uncharacterized protein n=1 Tax=Arctium lappa TaxID=4217 RepID=A0ACB9BCS5_ARCLA|nr:hypothetical protein L6452_21245 [Arctium lappa]
MNKTPFSLFFCSVRDIDGDTGGWGFGSVLDVNEETGTRNLVLLDYLPTCDTDYKYYTTSYNVKMTKAANFRHSQRPIPLPFTLFRISSFFLLNPQIIPLPNSTHKNTIS